MNEQIQADKKRVNMWIPITMIDELDGMAEELGGNRTSVVNMILREYLDRRAVAKIALLDLRNEVKK